MPLPRKPPVAFIQNAIQALVRSFPARVVTVVRPTGFAQTAGYTRGAPTTITVYQGEALFIPASGSIVVLQAGLVQDVTPKLMIAGNWVFKQHDRLTLAGRTYEVEFAPNRWNAFVVLRLKQIEDTGRG